MKKIIRKLKKVNKFSRTIYFLLIAAYFISYIFFAKSIISLVGIETLIRYFVLILLFGYLCIYVYYGFFKLISKKFIGFYIMSLISVILIIVFCFGSNVIDMVYGKLADFNEKEKVMYTSYLITLDDTTLNAKSVFGMVDDKDDIEGYILANQIIKEHKLTQDIESYDDKNSDAYLEMLYDLYDKKIDGIFVSSNYVTLYSSEAGFENIANDTKIVYQTSGEFNNKDTSIKSDKSLTEPFTALIMGVDSNSNGLNANAAFNGDTLILATFNPHTLSATLLSIPRDTYVPIACRNNKYAKINSSAASGTSCVIDTIEQLLDIQIDYYAKINFKGVVELVDAVGGVEVEVQKPDYAINHGVDCKGMVCEQNSDRKWGQHTIYIKPGLQTLNGEEALAYARCRGLYVDSDFARNRHQQDLIIALAKKVIKLGSYNDFKDLLDAVSNNIATNMSVNQILSSYEILKGMVGNLINDEELVSIQKAKLETYTLNVYLPTYGTTTMAEGYYEDSLEDIIKTMKINLELEEPEYIKTFSYSVNEDYQAKIAGAGYRSEASNAVLKGFVSKTKAEAQKYCNDNGFECSFKYVDENSKYYDPDIESDLIVAQSPHEGELLNGIHDITFYINGATSEL
ncbi:MAG: LCP family protein [Bacilli bacterium]|nr:LCP family protein [Bacilli bacterium]